IMLEMDIPADLPRIFANPLQLQQVILNIISNARYALNQKYPSSNELKKFMIKAIKTTIDDMPYVRIEFTDHGTGIPAAIVGKVLNPFFSTKPEGQGTGLGLSISHGIISDHGGRLSIESVEGEFTKVITTVPTSNFEDMMPQQK
ncbi:MAG: ATP-binding protein, partial [Thermodesulfovibrionales bacterium]